MSGATDRLFCTQPFRHMTVRPDGADLCPMLKKIGDIRIQSIPEIWNSPGAQEIRGSILDGSFSFCKQVDCPFLMTASGPVIKIDDLRDPEMLQAIRGRSTVLPHGPREISCSYDRSCNLSCPYCRTEVIIEEETAVLAIQKKVEEQALPQARVLRISGSGDAFASPYFSRWLQSLTPEKTPRLEAIKIVTHGLQWTPRTWRSLPEKIRALIVSANISIDAATAETYAVNRRGGDFGRLLKNLGFISGLRKAGPLKFLQLSFVVQANNFREMPAFVKLGRRFQADRIWFQKLVQRDSFTDEQMARHAVHDPRHPDHAEFLKVLSDPALDDPRALFGNLALLRRPWRKALGSR